MEVCDFKYWTHKNFKGKVNFLWTTVLSKFLGIKSKDLSPLKIFPISCSHPKLELGIKRNVKKTLIASLVHVKASNCSSFAHPFPLARRECDINPHRVVAAWLCCFIALGHWKGQTLFFQWAWSKTSLEDWLLFWFNSFESSAHLSP